MLALICASALLAPLLAMGTKGRLPVVIIEIAVDLLLGTSVLGWLDSRGPTFAFLANEIGFALVMVVAGSHVPLRSPALAAGLKKGALRAALIGVLAVPLGLGVAALFGTGHGLLYAVLFASSSAAVILPMLQGRDQSSPSMVELISQVAIADLACVIALPLAIDPAAAPRKFIGIILVAIAAGGLFLLLRYAQRWGWRAKLHRASKQNALALELRISLTVLFVIVALGQLQGLSPMLTGFAVGLVLAAVGEPRRLARQLFGVVLAASACLVHAVGALTKQPPSLAVLTASQLGVPAAAAAIGTSAGILLPGENASILIGAIGTLIVSTVIMSVTREKVVTA